MNGALLELVGGRDVRWPALRATDAEFLASCAEQDLEALAHVRIERLASRDEWPAEIRDALAACARRETAREMLRAKEIAVALGALSAAGAPAIVLKGTALAYSVYDTPIERPRLDTDVLIDPAHQDAARLALEHCGYTSPPYCDELFSQFQMEKTDAFGIRHVFDVHWKISTQPAFARVLTYEEMWPGTVPIPALGPAAVGPSAVDALLLACIHPVMHHQNAERILWIYDTHLLASRLTGDDFHEFVRLAQQKKIAAVCAGQLRRAQSLFETRLPADVLTRLSTVANERSADSLASRRTWRHELVSSLRALPGWRARASHLRRVVFPEPDYMRHSYGLKPGLASNVMLPVLYLHRNVYGGWKMLIGRK